MTALCAQSRERVLFTLAEMGIILGVAVLLHALLVRLLLLPVLMRYAGRAAWWQPAWLDRILPDVRFGH